MPLLEKLIAALPEGKVREARVGYFTTAVVSELSGGAISCGLASTIRSGSCSGPARFSGRLKGMNVKELAQLAVSGGGVEASLGMAAINSALPENTYEEINAEELITERAVGKTAAIIGHFPFTQRVRQKAGKLWVFELNPKDATDIPADKMPELLPQADVVAISALTLVNRTFDGIIANCKKDAFKILLGPSAPLSEIVFEYGIDVVSGSKVADIPALLEHLSEGVNFKSLPGKRLVTMRKAI
ncbi:MAG TPA: DUF364 domain-containing protein [Elusimicrobiales bacterium]|nr:DUF364 domain-containing protein [Elusimicrobiales bacterium]